MTGTHPSGEGIRPGWFDLGDDRAARAAWSRLAEPGDVEAASFVARRGAAAALDAVIADAEGVQRRWRVRLTGVDPRADRAALERCGGRLLVPGDEEWPTALDDLGLRRPFCLWVRGPLRLGPAGDGVASRPADHPGGVAVVGARNTTPYGERIAVELAAGCVDAGLTVVSGAAYGIDAAAHRGALGQGGATVAVLACGVDRPYPRGHAELIARIAAEGAVVSEVPPGTSPTRWRFVERNRLIAALSRMTVVVEAGIRSGASITAREAATLGRHVGAVPGPVTSPSSAGCHQLLRDGVTCITRIEDVLELLAPLGEYQALLPLGDPAEHDGLTGADARVYEALPLSRGAPVDSVARTAGLDSAEVTVALGRLEVLALAVREGGGWLRARRRSARRGSGSGGRR